METRLGPRPPFLRLLSFCHRLRGPMTRFSGTSGNDIANAITGQLVGFTGGTVADLQDATFDVFVGADGADVIFASDAGFRLIGGDGADEMHGGSDNDVFNFSPGNPESGEIIDGGGGSDTMLLENGSNGIIDFTVGVTITSIEELSFVGSAEGKFFANQFGGNGISLTSTLTGPIAGTTGLVTISMASVTTLDLSRF